ncbi:predicted permease duf318 [Lucifera butyrica]|uniref:Predicted permease duf318 n=1 Tax=Lucifera butyrica TaxID=1351585 RepID=A0A498QZY5_9FIRM|nr:permease [Lucifera butyrica]VBB05806.1 predicted permease duf318 [Lucifera butyrica]
MQLIQRYKFPVLMVLIEIFLLWIKPATGVESIRISADNLKEMLLVLPPIFVLLGLLDIWVPREVMLKLMGDESGLTGVMIAFTLGSVAAGPLYAAFPIAGVLLRKGCRFANIIVFIGAWSTTKIPLLLFEAASMGWKFMLVRLLLDVPIIVSIACFIEKISGPQEKKLIYENAAKFD